jgi:hypothetical protein
MVLLTLLMVRMPQITVVLVVAAVEDLEVLIPALWEV